jgi:hypothetical protein
MVPLLKKVHRIITTIEGVFAREVDDGDDEHATVDDGDRCLCLQELCSGQDECPYASPPQDSF